MSANRTPGDDWWSTEEATAASGNELLDAVLRAAAAPAHPGELAGEEAAVAAFRAAAAVETAPSRPSVFRTVLAKVLTVKAVIVLAVGGSAGIVLAASGGVLPAPWSATPQAPPAPAPRTTTPAPAAQPEHGTTRPGPSTQEPSIAELCAVYEAGRGKGKRLADPEFGPLVTAAGGENKVARYCAAHRTKPSKDERPQPSKDGKPADKPGGNEPEPPKSTKPGKADRDRTATPGRPPAHPPAPGGAATDRPHRGAGPPSRGG